MAREITLMKNINGEVEEFHPKTTTTNVIRNTIDGEKKLDDILDEKGAFVEYKDGDDIESPDADLLFEITDDLPDIAGCSDKVHGTMVQETAPTDTSYLWIDTSNEYSSVLKYFNQTKNEWSPININGGNTSPMLSHVGMIVQSTVLDTMEKVIEIYGGSEWTPIEGQFLLGASSTYAVNSTGGESEHTLTVSEMPSHTHQQYVTANNEGTYGIRQDYVRDGSGTAFPQCMTGYTGGNAAHNNMPPYKAVYIWERTA